MQRIVIALQGEPKSGKTTTIKRAYQELSLSEDVTMICEDKRSRKEVRRAILEIKGVKIGFTSSGDVKRILEEDLTFLKREDCSVIVCATHPVYTATYRVVQMMERECNVVWMDKQRDAHDDQEMADKIIREVRKAVENVQPVEA